MNDCPALDEFQATPTKDLRDHLALCLPCRVVADLIAERQRGIDALAQADECAKFEMLIAARGEGTIGATAGQLLDAHVLDCAACAAVVATVPPAMDRQRMSSLPAVAPSSYALGREVARGGMGRIIEALDLRIGRPVAVKELLSKAPALAARFEREARVTARLQHPGIVPIYEIGKWPDGTPFYAMRMVEGRTLREAIGKEQTLDERLALLPALIAAAEAVAFAHGKQIIHRDLTPNNILVGAHGDTVVIDWGLAKDLSDPSDEVAASPYRDEPGPATNLTSAGAVIGTAAYMPPEQASGASVDERADVYAIGAMLYHVLAGTPPYRASASDEVVQQVKAGPPPAIAAVAPGTPRDLVSIVDKSMARDPGSRYSTAAELADELQRFQAGRLVEAHHYSRGELVRRWIRKRRAAVIVFAVAAVALTTGGAFAVSNVVHERDHAEMETRDAFSARGTAEAERKASHVLNVTLLAEQGRQELLAGHWSRALPFLSAAYSDGDDTPETRFMIAAATSALDSRRLVLHGASGPAKSIVIDDARLLVVRDDVIELWDLVRGLQIATLRAPDTHFDGAVLSTDGTRVVTWSDATPTINVFDVAGGTPHVLAGHTQRILAASFAGPWVVSVAMDGTWRRWDVANGTSQTFEIGPLRRGGGGPAGFGAPAFDKAGKRLLVLRIDGTAEVWDIARGTRIGQFNVAKGYGASLSPDGARVIVWNVDTVVAWDVASGRQLGETRGPGYHMMGCGFRPDSAEVFVAGDRGELDVWTSDLHQRVAVLVVPGGMIAPMWLGHGRMVVVAATGSSELQLWDPDLETLVTTVDSLPQTFAVSADGVHFAVARDGGTVELLDLGALQLRRRMFEPEAAGNTGSPDASRVATYDSDGVVTLRDNDHEGRSISQVALHTPVTVSATRTVALGAAGELVVLDNSDGHLLHRWPINQKPTDLQLSTDGSQVLVIAAGGARLLYVDTGAERTRIAGTIARGQLADDGRTVFALDDHRQLIVWNVAESRATTTIQLPGEIMWTALLSVSPDGRRVALPIVESSGFTLRLYDAMTGKQLAAVVSAFLGRFGGGNMITSSIDGILHVIRAEDGTETHRFAIETGVNTPQPTPDGTRFVVSSPNGISEVRSLVDGRALARFKMRLASPHIDIDQRTFQYGLTIGAVTNEFFAAGNEGTAIALWDSHLETRSPAEIAKLVAQRVRWRLQDGRLVPAGDGTGR